MPDKRDDDPEIQRAARILIRQFTLPWRKQVAVVGVIASLYVATRVLLDMLGGAGGMSLPALYGDRWPLLPLRYVVSGVLIGYLSIQVTRWLAFRRWAARQATD